MNYELIDLTHKIAWNDSLNKIPSDQRDIYFTPEYYELCERNGEGKAMCFIFENDNQIALYPFLKNSVNRLGLIDCSEEYFDIQGAYGYNGVLSSNYDRKFIENFAKSFVICCKELNIIAEFTRFNPIIENHKFSQYLSIIKANKNVVVDLAWNPDDLWMKSYEHSTRKNIKKAERHGLLVKSFMGSETDEFWIKAFIDIYCSTMKRNNAKKCYWFNDEYFCTLRSLLSSKAVYFFTTKDAIAISCELVLFKGNTAYSFLGGTLADYFPFRPNDLLKHGIIMKLKNMGLRYYCIGGGIKIDDGIFRYKKSFAKNKVYDFYIGKRIHNKEIYDKVCAAWEKKYPAENENHKNMLLKYRVV